MSNSQTNSLLKLDVDQTAVAIGTVVALNKSPCLGNASRKMFMRIPVLPLATSTFKVQTAPRYDPATGAAPASGSSAWTDLATITSTSSQLQEITPDYWIRPNTTVAHADPNVQVYIEGVQ